MAVYQKGSRGLDVTRLEIRLKELGLYNGALDDVFGPGLESAVRAFQQRRGLPVTGIVDDTTSGALYAEPSAMLAAVRKKPAAYRSLTLTAGFETSTDAPDCFCGVAGNFDGQGISFGVLQWNLGQGTLQPMRKQLLVQHPQVMQQAFGEGLTVIQQVLGKDKPAQLAWAGTIQVPGGRRLAEPWHSRFKALGRAAECHEVQVQGAKDRYAQGLQMCQTYGLWSERGASLMFDIVVQNGSIRDATRQQILADFQKIPAGASREEQEVARMRVIANRRAEAANPKFVEDVRKRKLTIADGVGIVHGLGYDLERQFHLRLAPMA
ncbi:MAG: peptidoglycan-binding domain-containing protein [Longimicrobiaceae bacterium]